MVEDTVEVRAIGEARPGDAGFAVQTARDAAGALAMVEAGPASDRLFIDIVMPGELDGIGLAAEVARLRPGTRVLLTPGRAGRGIDHEQGRTDLDVMAKPYLQTDPVQKIRLLMDRGTAAI